MRPKDFWEMSMVEWACLIDGMLEKHGVKKNPAPATRDELEELLARFPDRKLTKEERARFKAYKSGGEVF